MKGCSCQPSCVPSLLSNFSLLLQSRVLLHEIYSSYTTGSPAHLNNFAVSARDCGITWGPRGPPSSLCRPRPAVAPPEIQSGGGAAAMMRHEAPKGTRDGSAEGGRAGDLPQRGEKKLSPRPGKPGGTAGRSRELRRRRQVRLAGRYALPPASCRAGRDRARLRRGPGTPAGGGGAGAQPAERARKAFFLPSVTESVTGVSC